LCCGGAKSFSVMERKIQGQDEQVFPNSIVLGACVCDFGLGELEIGPRLNFGDILIF